MSDPLKVFITGASSGIGRALAAEYARRGAILGLVARRADALADFRQSHPDHPVSIYPADVRDADALGEAARRFIDEYGLPDVVIANAGVSRGVLTGEGDLELKRIYVLHRFHGDKVGPRLLQAGLDWARQAGFRRVLLGAYGENHRALAFYRRNGFVQVGTRVFRVGVRDYDDVVLAVDL